MSRETKATDLAFPLVAPETEIYPSETYKGLCKREYFAALAMQGLLADGQSKPAEDAVRHADMLINQLNQPNKE